jgi:hypothetical protein
VFVVEKQLTKELFVMKMISIGQEGTEVRKKAQKEITAEINSWTRMSVSGTILRNVLSQKLLLFDNRILRVRRSSAKTRFKETI